MKSSTYLSRLTRLLVLGAIVAGALAATAGAVSRPPDVRDAAAPVSGASLFPSTVARIRAQERGRHADPRLFGSGQLTSSATLVTRPPDVRDAAVASNVEVGDAFERYAAAHPYGAGLSGQSSPVDRIIAQEQGRQHDLSLFSLGLTTPESSTLASRPPDVRDAAVASNVEVGDAFERYAAAHPYGAGQSSPVDRIIAQEQGRQHDLRLFSLGLTTPESSTLVTRPPDVSDAADTARYSGSLGQSSSFHWGDWAIGIGTGLGLVLLLGVGFMVGRQQRHRMQPA